MDHSLIKMSNEKRKLSGAMNKKIKSMKLLKNSSESCKTINDFFSKKKIVENISNECISSSEKSMPSLMFPMRL